MPFVREGAGGTVRVKNPLAEDEAYLRGNLLTTLASRAEHNLHRMQGNVRLFEIGTAFFPSAEPSRSLAPQKADLPREEVHVAVLVMGDRSPRHFTSPPDSYDEWDIKHLAEITAEAAFPAAGITLLPGAGDVLWEVRVADSVVGTVTRVKLDAPVWARPAYGLELNLQGVGERPRQQTKYAPIPVTPPGQIDLALLAGPAVTAEQIEAVIRREAGELLESVTLFDEFRGEGIPAGFRSLAWALTFRHPERTLKDKEVQGRTEKVLKALHGELGVTQR